MDIKVLEDRDAPGAADEKVTGRELSYLLEDRGGSGNEMKAEVLVQRLPVKCPLEGLVLENGLQLRREQEGPTRKQGVEQGLFPQPVPREKQRSRLGVPDGKGEHPPEGLD